MEASEAAGDPADLRLPSLSELQVMQHVLGNVEGQAIDSLDIALAALEIALVVGEYRDVIESLIAAKTQLLDSRRTIGHAIHAENATRRALTTLPKQTPRRALECAERRIRDAIVLRAQMSAPLGSRTIFMKTLDLFCEYPVTVCIEIEPAYASGICHSVKSRSFPPIIVPEQLFACS